MATHQQEQIQQQQSSAMDTSPPNPLDTDGLCLLSIDGGGVRGLASLYILKSVMDRLNTARRDSEIDSSRLKPCDVFDLIGGTSTGGLIAIMLGRLEMDIDQCIDAYNNLAETVFGERLTRIPMSWRARTTPRFDASKLEQAVRETLVAAGEKEDALFNDGKQRSCKTFVCAMDEYTKDIVRLRDYNLPNEQEIQATVIQAARATSAATTFFEPVNIGSRRFSDGALGANNPSEQVEEEASDIWCADTGDLKPLVKCFISIGTGKQSMEAVEKNLFKFLGKTLVAIATETEKTEKAFIARWRKHYDEDRYFRFNVEQGLQAVDLEEFKKRGQIEAATLSYLNHITQKFRVRDCVENLKKKNLVYGGVNPSIRGIKLVEIIKWRSQQLQARLEPQKIPKVHFIVPLNPDPDFVTRLDENGDDILERLFNDFQERPRIGLVGLGGVGKSQIAVAFAHRFRRKYQEASVFWVDAGDSDHFNLSYQKIATELGIDTKNEPQLAPMNLAEVICGMLSQPEFGRWLMILDNLDDDSVLGETLGENYNGPLQRRTNYTISRYIPQSENGSVLITSRSTSMALELTNSGSSTIQVQDMTSDEAQNLLKLKVWSHDYTTEDAREFVHHMEGLPLAITQAAAYMTKCRMTVRAYIDLFTKSQSNQLRLMSKEFKDLRRNERPRYAVLFTWHTSFERIQTRHPSAANMLSIMSIYHHQGIPSFLLQKSVADEMEFFDAIEPLMDLCLISKRSSSDMYDLHLFVKLATRAWINEYGELDDKQNKSLAIIFEALQEAYSRELKKIPLLLPHFVEMTDIEVQSTEDIVEMQKFRIFVAGMRAQLGDYRGALSLYNKAISSLSGDSDDDICLSLNAQSGISLALLQAGDFGEAKTMAETAYQHFKNHYENHDGIELELDTRKLFLEFFKQIGTVLNATGNPYAAGECFQEGLKIAKAIGDTSHIQSALGNLIEYYCAKGEVTVEVKELLDQYTDTNDYDDHTIAASRRLKALVHLGQGDFEEALVLMRDSWKERVRSLGENHPYTVVSAANYLHVLKSVEPLEARDFAEELLDRSRKLWGDSYIAVLAIKEHLATCLSDQGYNDRAISLLKEVKESKSRLELTENTDSIMAELILAELQSITTVSYHASLNKMTTLLGIAEKDFSESFWLIAKIKCAIAMLHSRHGENSLSQELFERVVSSCEAHYSDKNMRALQMKCARAVCLLSSKCYQKAAQLFLQVLSVLETSFKLETTFTFRCKCKCDLARCYFSMQENEKLEELYAELRDIAHSHCIESSNPTRLISGILHILDLFHENGKHEWTLSARQKILESHENSYGPNHEITLSCQNNLALCLRNLGRYEEAEKLDRETLNLRIENLHPDDPAILLSMNNLAMVLADEDKWLEARAMQEQCVEGCIRVLGDKHQETLRRKQNLLWILKNLNEYDSAEDLAKGIFEDRLNLLGPNNEETLAAQRSLIEIWRAKGKHSNGMEMCAGAIDSHHKVLGRTHVSTLWLLWTSADSFVKENTKLNLASQMFDTVFKADYHKSDAVVFDKSSFFLAYCQHLFEKGRNDEMEYVAREFIIQYEKSYGINCPESDILKLSLAFALRNQQRPAEAVDILYTPYLRKTEETTMAGNHGISCLNMRTFIQTVDQEGKIRPHALNLVLRWAEMLQEFPTDETVCKAADEIGLVLSKFRRPEAHAVLQLSIKKNEEFYGSNSTEVVLQKTNAANDLWLQGLYLDSYKQKALLTQQLGLHVDSNRRLWLDQCADIAYMSCACGDISKAVKEEEDILKQLLDFAGSWDLSLINAFNKFAYAVLLNGELERCKKIIQENTRRRDQIQKSKNSNVPVGDAGLTVSAMQGKWREVLNICNKLYPVDFEKPSWSTVSAFRGVSLMSLGRVLLDQVDEGLLLARLVYTEQTRIFGSHHPETLNRYFSLGLALWHTGDYEQAELVVRGVWKSRLIVSGRGNIATMAAANLLGLIYRDMAAHAKAEAFLRSSYIGFREKLRDGHPERDRVLRNYITFLVTCWKTEKIRRENGCHSSSPCQHCAQVSLPGPKKDFGLPIWL